MADHLFEINQLQMDRNQLKLIVISVTSSVGLFGVCYLFKRLRYKREFDKLKLLRDERKAEKTRRFDAIDARLREREAVDAEESEAGTISELLARLRKDRHCRHSILRAFQRKALAVHRSLNCVVEFLEIDESEIDYEGPLAGLPVSIKDNLSVRGYYNCVGCSYFLKQPASENCVLVDVIKSLGGVPFAKTTVPQTMMSFLSSNPIDGITHNPLNLSKSPGGSSSGEAALIGGGGSIVGLGTDIGGSVRLPAAFCGIVGFKPTYNRLSKKGLVSLSNNSLIRGVCGVLGKDVDCVAFLFEQICNSQLHRKLDPRVIPMDFYTSIFKSKEKLTIGYFEFDGSYRCVPAIERAVLEVVQKFENNGYKVVKWRPPMTGEQWLTLFLRALAVDKCRDVINLCQYDEIDFTIKNLLKMFSLSSFELSLKKFRAYLSGNKEALIWLKASQGLSSSREITKILEEIIWLRNTIFEEWKKLGIDVVICPTSGFASVPLKPSGSLTGMLSYMNLWNLVDYPAGTVPVSKINQADIEKLKDYPKNLSSWHYNTFEAQKDSLGMSVSVQCVTKTWNEEMCLRIMKEIEGMSRD